MKRSIEPLAIKSRISFYDHSTAKKITQFAQLVLSEIVDEIRKQKDSPLLNVDPAEHFASLIENMFDLEVNEKTGVKFTTVDSDTHVMTVAEFEEENESGMITSDDGSGYYMSSKTEKSNVSVWSYSKPSWATHVAWYNK